MTDTPPEITLEENIAADEHRAMLLYRSDALAPDGAPLWHGWALFDAFIAGIRWQHERTGS